MEPTVVPEQRCSDRLLLRALQSSVYVLSVALSPAGLNGQTVSPRTLPQADVIVNFEFERIVGIRELLDGGALVSDAGTGALYVVNFSTRSARQVGRVGAGPGEYAFVAPLHPRGRDSTVMFDRGTRRWVLLHGDTILSVARPRQEVEAAGLPTGLDNSGFAYTLKFGNSASDSLAIVRLNMIRGQGDTIARLDVPPARESSDVDRDGNVTSYRRLRPAMAVGEEAQVFPDGWLAVARLNPYRVDWLSPSGAWTRGDPLPFTVQRVDDREKAAHHRWLRLYSGRPNATRNIAWWVDEIPPFQPSPLVPTVDGRLAVLRTPTARAPRNQYDIVDRRGALVDRLDLPENARIVGFGSRHVYVAVMDEDGIQRLDRRPWSERK